jgi:hypothetical protein
MVLRGADYPRKANENYPTPREPASALVPLLTDVGMVLIPSDRGSDSILAATLRAHGIATISGIDADFLDMHEPPSGCDCVCDNPPYGKQSRLAEQFIAHAITLVPFVAMLLPADYDSARSRAYLFRDCPFFAGRLILLQRIVWFPGGPSSPATNHMWALWDRSHRGLPVIHYEDESNLPARRRRHLSLPASNRWLPSTVGQQGASGRGVTAVASSKGPKDHE